MAPDPLPSAGLLSEGHAMTHLLATDLVDDSGAEAGVPLGDVLARAGEGAPVAGGRVLVPTARAHDLASALRDGAGAADHPVRVVAVGALDGPFDPTLAAFDVAPGTRLDAIEVPWPQADDALAALADLKDARPRTRVLARADVDEHLDDRLQLLTVLGLGVSVDASGLDVAQVERLVRAIVLHGVPLAVSGLEAALTAGQTVGALNVLVAVLRLVDGWPVSDTLTADASTLRAHVDEASVDVQRAARSLLVAVRSPRPQALAAQITDVLGA